jgi:hypothetical protein
MRRPHRRWHRRIWLILPGLIGLALVAALVLRPAAPIGEGPLVSGSVR